MPSSKLKNHSFLHQGLLVNPHLEPGSNEAKKTTGGRVELLACRPVDGTVERDAHRWYEFRGSLNQAIGRRFRLIGRAYYFTDASSQALYQQNVWSTGNVSEESA